MLASVVDNAAPGVSAHIDNCCLLATMRDTLGTGDIKASNFGGRYGYMFAEVKSEEDCVNFGFPMDLARAAMNRKILLTTPAFPRASPDVCSPGS